MPIFVIACCLAIHFCPPFFTAGIQHFLQQEEDQDENEEEEEEVRDVYAVRRTDYGEITDFKASGLGSRRLQLAHKVCLDAKFLNHTKRLATRSALLLPLRTPQAPLIGTYTYD